MEFVRNEVDVMYREMAVDAMGAQSEDNEGLMAEEPNSRAREFYDLLHVAKVHIGAGGQDVIILSWMVEMLNMKTLYNMSAANWEMSLSLSQKLLSPKNQEKKDVPRKSLWYLPITPRLQRLYMSRKMTEYMTWHLKCRENADEVIHPAVAKGIDIPRWRLLPIAFRDFLINEVWGPLTEISNFFRALTALIIQVSNMEMWEEKIIETICKLEKVFPPAFFDLMEHLAIHLPYEAKVGGHVQFHWMYPFERARAIIDTSWLSDGGNDYYQDDDPPLPQLVQPSTVLNDHVSLASQGGEQVVISEQLSTFTQLPTHHQQEQPTVTQPTFDNDQYHGDDATMEEDTKEHNLEVELDVEFAVLDPELDAQLEEKLSHAIPKTRRGMDKGDDTLADPSQRKLLSLNRRGTFSH
ncbi:hypothetical protein SLEP1_g17561 [Rubroshorea leprosula]|uniref:DUF4218 domain-containing protein n=1 Tax=Rubroshorea leprosula TaxID=152421 RepID=A0AAV5J0J9_9ROSI|nr:hypothetical protein SLEP1_g17561 [Rubroshorea leprosula]